MGEQRHALIEAILRDSVEDVKNLVPLCGVCLDLKDNTVLHLAARYCSLKCLRWMVEGGIVPIDAQNIRKETCGHQAVKRGSLLCVRTIVNLCTTNSSIQAASFVCEKDLHGMTLLHCATNFCHDSIALWLLQHFGLHLASRLDNDGQTALHCAALKGRMKTVTALSKFGKQLTNLQDSSGATPLFCACQEGHTRCAHLLLTLGGADASIADDQGMTPLLVAINEGQVDTVRYLMRNGADLTQRLHDASTVFHLAAVTGHVDTLHLLLKYDNLGILHWEDDSGSTAAHVAAKRGHVICLKTLADAGLSIHHNNKKGESPYSLAHSNSSKCGRQVRLMSETDSIFAEARLLSKRYGRLNAPTSKPTIYSKLNGRCKPDQPKQEARIGMRGTSQQNLCPHNTILLKQKHRPALISMPMVDDSEISKTSTDDDDLDIVDFNTFSRYKKNSNMENLRKALKKVKWSHEERVRNFKGSLPKSMIRGLREDRDKESSPRLIKKEALGEHESLRRSSRRSIEILRVSWENKSKSENCTQNEGTVDCSQSTERKQQNVPPPPPPLPVTEPPSSPQVVSSFMSSVLEQRKKLRKPQGKCENEEGRKKSVTYNTTASRKIQEMQRVLIDCGIMIPYLKHIGRNKEDIVNHKPKKMNAGVCDARYSADNSTNYLPMRDETHAKSAEIDRREEQINSPQSPEGLHGCHASLKVKQLYQGQNVDNTACAQPTELERALKKRRIHLSSPDHCDQLDQSCQ